MPAWTSEELRPRHSAYRDERTLFPVSLKTFEVETQVSTDEMRRWHQAGWLDDDSDYVQEIAASMWKKHWQDGKKIVDILKVFDWTTESAV